LNSGGAQSGTRSVGYDSTDTESGVAKVEILLDDSVVQVRDFSADVSSCPYTSWNACPERVVEEVAVDTRMVPDGTYTVGVRVTDAAGNRTVSRSEQVVVRNAAPSTAGGPSQAGGQPGGSTAAGPPTGIHLTHVNSERTFVTSRLIRYGSRATLRGVLRGPAGDPIPNAVVDVLLRTERKNSRLRKVTSRTTDANGRFEYRTNPGPSRLVRFGYGRTSANSTYSFTHDIKVKTKAGLTLHVSRSRLRNGQSVRFHGTIRGNKQRKVLEVQVHKPGGWDTIASVRSDSKGRWSWRYRFKRTFEPTRYAFRARARTESGFPFATGHSRQRHVRVR
jgi:protocatechuate 3,4-dioxygenase beta subunit